MLNAVLIHDRFRLSDDSFAAQFAGSSTGERPFIAQQIARGYTYARDEKKGTAGSSRSTGGMRGSCDLRQHAGARYW